MSRSDMVYSYTERKINYLERIANTGAGKGIMAELRRGVGKKVGELPELWGIVFDRIPEELLGLNEPSFAEWAVYTALTLYALHQQGSDESMHKKDISFGNAVSMLVENEDDQQRILNRLNVVATSVTQEDISYNIRGIIQLLKNKGIKLDYARLAKELYLFCSDEYSFKIKLSWGRDFYRCKNNKKDEGEDK